MITESRPSLARSSLSRVLAEIGSLVLFTAAGVITARVLGPAGKGELTALLFLIVVFSQLSVLGLGDSSVVLAGQRRWTIQQGLSATIAVSPFLALAGSVLLILSSVLELPRAQPLEIGLAVVAMVLSFYYSLSVQFLNARERFTETSLISLGTAGVLALSTWLFVAELGMSVAGALLAGIAGVALGIVTSGWILMRSGYAIRASHDAAFVRDAFRYGARLQVTQLVVTLAGRADLLIVLAIAGEIAAGYYSVALTVSSLVALVPVAIAYASFPRIAYVDQREARWLVAFTFRNSVAVAIAAAVALAIVAPTVIPAFFGVDFAPAVLPALILLPACVLGSGQWILGRASAARGRPNVLMWSYLANLASMTIADFILIPRAGTVGAAVAAVLAAVVGLIVSIKMFQRADESRLGAREFFPRANDVRFLLRTPRFRLRRR